MYLLTHMLAAPEDSLDAVVWVVVMGVIVLFNVVGAWARKQQQKRAERELQEVRRRRAEEAQRQAVQPKPSVAPQPATPVPPPVQVKPPAPPLPRPQAPRPVAVQEKVVYDGPPLGAGTIPPPPAPPKVQPTSRPLPRPAAKPAAPPITGPAVSGDLPPLSPVPQTDFAPVFADMDAAAKRSIAGDVLAMVRRPGGGGIGATLSFSTGGGSFLSTGGTGRGMSLPTDIESIRRAIIYSEILQPPLALRDDPAYSVP
ncbi:MAG: hypothetical protein BIFFINMI_03388 [Phycisphaerae bacterium]|nr:hypothetical protein [Phycisphaerae bacterium]